MSEFVIGFVIWVLALYGLIEIVKAVVDSFTYKNVSSEGIYIIVTVKDGEDRIEGFIRSFLVGLQYEKDKANTNIILVGLESTDRTNEILGRLKKEYRNIKFTSWGECKEIIDGLEGN